MSVRALRPTMPRSALSRRGFAAAGVVTWTYSRRVPADRSMIRVKAMLVAPNDDLTAHAVSLNPPTEENPDGYHRLIGGGVHLGETAREAVLREVQEELGAAVHGLEYLTTVENIFRIDGVLGHEVVFLYSGRLNPQPATSNATLTESDGSVVPVAWRRVADDQEPLPLYPAAAAPWLRRLRDVLGGAVETPDQAALRAPPDQAALRAPPDQAALRAPPDHAALRAE